MWIPQTIITWLDISLDTVRTLREENAALRARCSALESDLVSTKVNSDWFRFKVNDLEVINKALLERAYDIHLPVPQIVKEQTAQRNPYQLPDALFEHIDDDTAKALGLT